MCQVRDRGGTLGDIKTVCQLVTTNSITGNLELRRSNTATNTDTFRVFPFPVPAVNPATNKLGHLYVAYADRGTNIDDRADVFLTVSTNRGTNWSSPTRINADSTTNDQWMPVLAIKPDGTQLFIAWYDRRHDTNNSLMHVYGCFATIGTNGSVDFGVEFQISSQSFPAVFAGTRGEVDPIYKLPGFYDPSYPPGGVSLNWWYPEWPATWPAADVYKGHVGEYNAAFASTDGAHLAWTDYRLPSAGSSYPRAQSDIRFLRIPWP
jgi:hypothetical protein